MSRGRAVFLPDDHGGHRLAAYRVPGKAALALVGEADRIGLSRRLEAGDYIGEQFLGIMLDPAGLRIDLSVPNPPRLEKRPSASSR